MAKDDANQVKPADSDDKHELWDRLEALRTVMLTTQDAEGRMGSRPVTVLKIDEGRMWFFIPITGGIADEVKRDPEVHISVMDKDDDLFVSLRGDAQVMRDPAKAKERLGWVPETTLEELIRLMTRADLELLGR